MSADNEIMVGKFPDGYRVQMVSASDNFDNDDEYFVKRCVVGYFDECASVYRKIN